LGAKHELRLKFPTAFAQKILAATSRSSTIRRGGRLSAARIWKASLSKPTARRRPHGAD
jgi:hypothetical protein